MPPVTVRRVRRCVVALLLGLAAGTGDANARSVAESRCRHDCTHEYAACRRLAGTLRHGCYDHCVGSTHDRAGCRAACPITAYRQNSDACRARSVECRSGCNGIGACAEECVATHEGCVDDVFHGCRSCTDSGRVSYKHCRHALHPRRCRAPVLVDWGECLDRCGPTVGDAFAPCAGDRESCLTACASPGGAFLD
jgi:hypothetical protein